MNNADEQYLSLVQNILNNGIKSDDRTGVGTMSLFSPQMRFNLSEGFPLLTTKKVPFGLIKSELLWFLKGDTNIKYLLEQNNHIWDEWGFQRWVDSGNQFLRDNAHYYTDALQFQDQTKEHGLNYRFENERYNKTYDFYMKRYRQNILTDNTFAKEFGELGPVYGKQWRDFNGKDQIQNLLHQLKTNPSSRRLIVSAWNPKDVDNMALPPCHTMFQLYVRDNTLSCHLYQRSGDVFLGVPFNIASYALLTHIIAADAGLQVGEFVHTIGDAHIYKNHMEQINEQLDRKNKATASPQLHFNKKDSIFDYEPSDFKLVGYDPLPPIKAPVAV